MKITYNWLKDFVDIRIPAKELAKKLTMAGLEVTSLEERGGDFVLELEITSNRPDCLSVIGIAREAAAITNKKFNVKGLMSNLKNIKHSTLNIKQLSIKIEDKRDCPLYTARIIKGIQVKPSPDWLKRRLELVGLRSVNNIVDITNYALMETGQPLHAFDLNRLINQLTSYPVSRLGIIVRRAKKGEEIITIDGIKRILSQEILIIASEVNRQTGKPIAIAGIMGGIDSEVNEKTSHILLEAAVFDPIITRRASRRLGLSSESSYRFERGVDCRNVNFASLRATQLISAVAGGEVVISKTTGKPRAKEKTLVLKTEEVNRILGRDYAPSQINRALVSLGFTAKKQKAEDFKIRIPSFRIDINHPVDLIEEVARISGYENILTRLPKIIPQMDTSLRRAGRRVIKEILMSQGVNEVITYSLISKIRAGEFGYPDAQLITIANPLTSEQEILRPSIIPGLVSCIGYNLNQKQKDVRIFEIGQIFRDDQEQSYLGLACSGKEFNPALSYSSSTLSSGKGGVNLLYIKGILALLLMRLGITDYEFIKLDNKHPYLQKEMSLSLIVGKKICANLGMIKPDILKSVDVQELIFAAELDLSILLAEIGKIQKRYTPLPLFPEVIRDMSIMIKQDISVGDVIKKIKINKVPYLIKLNIKDYYLGKQIPRGLKGLTLSCTYQAVDRTLTTKEIDVSHQKVLEILRTEFSAQQR
jgi:phenylalanyl-tRNA synthetase beta chain